VGTAITLASQDDADQIASIEKLMQTSIPTLDAEAAPEAAAAETKSPESDTGESKAAESKSGPKARSRSRKAEDGQREAEKREPRRREAKPRSKPASAAPEPERKDVRDERSAELEPAEEGWNGPVPSFLGKGFGS
jgi:superfamily II DNA/RNA helicase